MSSTANRIALRTSLVYAGAGILWIVGSDWALRVLAGSDRAAEQWQTYKGWVFIVATGGLLYTALRSQILASSRAAAARERAEADLRLQRERLQLALREGNIGLWEVDFQTNQIYLSPEWKRQLGYGDDELKSDPDVWPSLLHPADAERAIKAMDDFVKSGAGHYQQEFRLRHRDGSYRWILSQGILDKDPTGRPLRMLGLHVDLTSSKQAEAALRDRALMNARLAQVATVVPGAIVSYHQRTDGTTAFPYASPAFEDVFGFKPEEVDNDASAVFDCIHADDRARVDGSIAESARTSSPWRSEFRYRHRKKGEIWIEGFALSQRQSDGSLRWNGFMMDVTGRKRAEVRVHQLNRVYALLSEVNQTIVRVRGAQALYEAACRIAAEKGGFRLAWIASYDAAAQKVSAVAVAGNVDPQAARFTLDLTDPVQRRAPGAVAVLTNTHVICNNVETDPGLDLWRGVMLAQGYRSLGVFPLRVKGRVVAIMALIAADPDVFDPREVELLDQMAMDLSFALEVTQQEAERHRAETSLRENEERFRQLAENIREIFWMVDPVSGRILYVSRVYEFVTGRTVDSLYANPLQWRQNIHPDDLARVNQAMGERLTDGTFDEEYRILRADGKVRWVRSRAFPIRDDAGQVYRLAGVTEDVTDRKELEDQFFRAQRLEAIGTLASGIAHDLNNILAPIMMCAPMLRMGLPPPEFEKMLGTIESSTRRGADLVRQLLVFGRGLDGGRCAVRPKDLVNEMLKIASETFPRQIEVSAEVEDGLWTVLGDPTQLHQVLLNLCVNARDAMPDGGQLTVGAKNIELDAAVASAHRAARPGRYINIWVRDTGCGISPQSVAKIFDPFFTTKEPGKGTGLGLSTVSGIVKSHGGFVTLDTKVGEGTCFEVYLPAEMHEVGGSPGSLSVPVPRGNGQLVLLVEDEQSIRDVIADLLVKHSYRVMVAEDGLEGETLFRENIDDISLVLTDLDMPRMDGLRLIEAIRKSSPTVPVVVSSGLQSGWASDDRAKRLEAAGVKTVLAKPYATSEILTAIHAALLP